ncbi:MAG: histidine kinase [Paracoccaceae bacterium]
MALGSITSWKNRSLAAQFALAGGVVIVLSMILIGRLVASRIEDGVVRNTALATSQYMDSIISPLTQDLALSDELSWGARRALDEIFGSTQIGERVVSYKFWKPDGLVAEASDKSLVGQRFEPTDDVVAALNGEIRADFAAVGDETDDVASGSGGPLLQIFIPIREDWSGRIIGVAEFHEAGTQLQQDLVEARRNSWLAVAVTFGAIGLLLYLIVLRGSRTIDRQREELTRRLRELSALSAHNAALRDRVQQAAARASAMNDRALRQIGADLHDGPAQLLSFAALRLDNLNVEKSHARDLDEVERAVKDAIREVRDISRGLSLPDIEARGACDLLKGVIEAHSARTSTEVALDCEIPGDRTLPAAVKICLYRFVQEGLMNAWRYAAGAGQEVRLTEADGLMRLSVADRGPGFGAAENAKDEDDVFGGMGLAGLRDRVESIGGTIHIGNRADGPGGEIRMEIDLGESQWM